MLNFPRWKIWGISLLCALCVLMAVPSFLPPSVSAYLPRFAQAIHVNLGLDLAGGSQLLLEAQVQDVAKQRGEAMEDLLRTDLSRSSIPFGQMAANNGEVSFVVTNPAQVGAASQRATAQVNQVGFEGADWTVSVSGSRVTMRQTQAGMNEGIRQTMESARDVIDRRINALGTLEPTIIRQGASRILVQVPGLQDPAALVRLIGRTARLEFKMVSDIPNVTCQTRVPPGNQVLRYSEGGPNACIAVQRRAIIVGERIANAVQDFDENGLPSVTVSFDTAGSHAFARVTQNNVGKPFAIILDNVVISAPRINQAIMGGVASISGSFTVETANQLAISLRSGRLPVELRVVEERSVGAELGADSIRSGVIASIAATLVVILFMLITYGRFGVYTTIALVLNGLMILGVMALFNATLTLPGIAGFVLTVGGVIYAAPSAALGGPTGRRTCG